MSSAAVRQVIALAAELSEEERRVVVDAIAPQESVAGLAAEWEAEIARRADRVRTGQSTDKPAAEVFDRLEARLKAVMAELIIEPEAEAELVDLAETWPLWPGAPARLPPIRARAPPSLSRKSQ